MIINTNKLFEEYESTEDLALDELDNAGMPIVNYMPDFVSADCDSGLSEDYFTSKTALMKHYDNHVEHEDGYMPETLAFPYDWCSTPDEYLQRALDLARAPMQGVVGATANAVGGFACQDAAKSADWERGDSVAHYSNGDTRPDKQRMWVFCKYRWNTKIANDKVKDPSYGACETVYYFFEHDQLIVKSYMLKPYGKLMDDVESLNRSHNADKTAGTRTESRFANSFEAKTLAKDANRTARCLCLSLVEDSRGIGVHFDCTNSVHDAQQYYIDNDYAFLCCIFQGEKFQLLTGK